MSTTERIVLLLNIVYVYFSPNTVTKKVDLWQVYIECRRCRQDVKVYVLAVWPLSSATRRPAFIQFTGCQQPVKRSYSLIGQKMQLTGWHNGNEMRNVICVDTQTSIDRLYLPFLIAWQRKRLHLCRRFKFQRQN